MPLNVLFSQEPAEVLETAREFLSSEPVLHNLLLTILHARVGLPDPGRYWVAMRGDEPVGVVLQSPLDYPATMTPMQPDAIAATVDAITKAGVALPGIVGDAATAAAFAGQWSERSRSGATPFQGMRLYELVERGDAPPAVGRLRQAVQDDRDRMILWTHAFQDEIGEGSDGTEQRVDKWLALGQIWVWEHDGQPLSMAVSREPVIGVVRVSGVYTPPDSRKRGYAGACVHALSSHLRDGGYRCALYTDLANPTSNSIYRRIGYRAVGEAIRYRFEAAPPDIKES